MSSLKNAEAIMPSGIRCERVGQTETPDQVSYNDSALDVERLNELIQDL